MKKDFALAWLVARRELKDQLRDWRILAPMFILTVFFPFLMNYAAISAVNFVQKYGADLIAERMVPFLLLVVGFFPVTSSLVVALESFVGEKERGTIEPLLSSPLTDWHLYVGKLLAGSLVPLAASYIGITIYIVGILYQQFKFPDLNVIVQTLVLTAVQVVLMVSGAMVVSAQATSVRAANLLASFIIIPVTFLIQGESTLIFWGNNQVLWLAVISVSILSVLLIRLGLMHFKRENLIGRDIDMMNLRWVWNVFWKRYNGDQPTPMTAHWIGAVFDRIRRRRSDQLGLIRLAGALVSDLKGFFRWYGVEIPRVLRIIRTGFIIAVLIGAISIAGGYIYAESVVIPLVEKRGKEITYQEIGKTFSQVLDIDETVITPGFLFNRNFRAELAIIFFGAFSFGVLGIMIMGLNFGLIGAVMALVDFVGMPSWLIFVTGILPHGIFELPSLLITGAVILHMGVRMVTPEARQSLSEVFIESIADWAKLAVGLTIPLLIVAAFIEAYITPSLLYAVFGKGF